MMDRRDKLRERALNIIKTLQFVTKNMPLPASTAIVKEYGRDPYLVLISCLLSLRTKDTVSLPASQRLFMRAKTPEDMLKIPLDQLEEIIYPVGFFHKKAIQLHKVSTDIIQQFDGKVPSGQEALLSIKGVGRKTMNLVRAEGFGIPAICVDVHVHRISNRLGLVKTRTPEQTEHALMALLPEKYWIEYTRLLVMWGQNICVPLSPFCSRCAIAPMCQKIGVTRFR